MSRWTIEVLDVPPSLNKVLRMHWAVKRRLMGTWMDWMLCRMSFAARRSLKDASKAQERVKMHITLHNARQYDRDNAFGAVKVIVDAARACGLIHDDRPEFLDLEVKQEKSTRKGKKTVIEFEICERKHGGGA